MSGNLEDQCKIFALMCLFCIVNAAQEPKIKDIKALSDKLMDNYSKYILPSENRHDPFNLAIYVNLEAVGNIDEIEEKLSTVLYLEYEWKDESIHWSLADTNVSFITLAWSDVWKPVVRVINPQTDSSNTQYRDRSYETVFFDNEGWAYYTELMTTRTSCEMDMSYYPFDTQICDIKMTLIEASKFPLKLHVALYEGFALKNADHGSWDLISMNISSKGGSFFIELKFKRRPLFILLNIILPLFILALLTPIVFLLPKKSGERVGYSVAMLLAISVYMTIVSEHLPENSNPVPLMPIMIFSWYVFDAFIVLVVIINTKLNLTTSRKPVPMAFCKFILLTRKLVCQRNEKGTEKNTTDERQKCIEMENVEKNEEDTEGSERMHNASFEEPIIYNVTWQELSHAIDKWCFVISYLVKIALPLIFLTVMKCNSRE
ncbi:acetylcholine receptor subunit delta-like [Mercenaria mercenaria]|uniref:acetylcholine receptor subunit delta-like n=1 Tax=Mercenaria mercenaria TaxID=6596 RepID=UPI00234FA8F2|nr:acetylcholine receptor subunit delta-like [Mercenaria mercenaria]